MRLNINLLWIIYTLVLQIHIIKLLELKYDYKLYS